MSAILLPMWIAGAQVQPALTSIAHDYTSGGSGVKSGVQINTDGYIYQIDGVTYTAKHKWLTPAHKASYTDASIYLLTNGMEGGDTTGTWHQVGGSGGGNIEFWNTSAGLNRYNTLYFSWGVRSGTTLGATDKTVSSTIRVPA